LRDLLTDAEGVSNVVLMGDGVHLLVDNASIRVSELRARIASENLPLDRIEEVTPTIEDLFVQAVGRESARA
jgi:ABC-type uncharacterized transport system ATPase subunit